MITGRQKTTPVSEISCIILNIYTVVIKLLHSLRALCVIICVPMKTSSNVLSIWKYSTIYVQYSTICTFPT